MTHFLNPPARLRLDGQPKRHGGGKPKLELAGERHGVLLILGRVEKPSTYVDTHCHNAESWWACQCDCGRHLVLMATAARFGRKHCRCDLAPRRTQEARTIVEPSDPSRR